VSDPAEPSDPSVSERISGALDRVTGAERRVADVVLTDPEVIAFGTVAEVARSARTSGATVVRAAAKLGYDGFPALQAAVRAELSRRLRPATERIREPDADDIVGLTLRISLDAVEASVRQIDRTVFAGVTRLLATRGRAVRIICGDESDGVGLLFATRLSMLRDGISTIGGSPVATGRQVASVSNTDVIVAIDLRRYDRWLLDALDDALERGATVIALTDSPISPLADRAEFVFVVAADGPRPFDSYVGALAVLDAVASGVAQRLKAAAAEHLDRIEASWQRSGALTDGTN